MGLCMSYERSSKEDAKTGGFDPCLVSIRAESLLRKAETVNARKGSALEVQKAIEKNDNESWYFTHL
jgi:hypothetical protein